MSGIMQFEFCLFGPRKGQTVVLNNHQFVNGLCILVQSSDNMGTAARVFSFYDAYARGTPEYDRAMAAEEAAQAAQVAKEVADGADEVLRAPNVRANPEVPAGIQPVGGGPPEVGSAIPGAGHADASGGTGNAPNADANGNGHADSGIPEFPEDKDYRAVEPASSVNVEVAAAVRKLDPDVDAHWVLTGAHKGKPKLQAVEDAYGKAGLTRQDIEAASPGYNRGAASERALA